MSNLAHLEVQRQRTRGVLSKSKRVGTDAEARKAAEEFLAVCVEILAARHEEFSPNTPGELPYVETTIPPGMTCAEWKRRPR